MNECLPMMIRFDAQASIVAADIADCGITTRISENFVLRYETSASVASGEPPGLCMNN